MLHCMDEANYHNMLKDIPLIALVTSTVIALAIPDQKLKRFWEQSAKNCEYICPQRKQQKS